MSAGDGSTWLSATYSADGVTTWTCEACGRLVTRYRGESDVTCACGAEFNAFGQRLRDDWRGNPSAYDDEVSDLDGFEMQHANDDAHDEAASAHYTGPTFREDDDA